MDVLTLSRIQFGFTVGYHFLLVPFSLGLTPFMVFAERLYYKRGDAADKAASTFLIKLFTTTFAIGVASGLILEFGFGTNWARYSHFVGDIFGTPLAAEGITAFFLESTFLGVLLFGRDRVSKRFYYVSAWLVLIGAHLSAVWILIANSWMQTPRGFAVVGGKAVVTDWLAAIFNPSFPPRLLHTVVATWVAGAFAVVGIAAYYLLKERYVDYARRIIVPGLLFAFIASVAMLGLGHFHAVEVAREQPAKLASFESVFTTRGNVPLWIFGYVDEANKRVIGLPIPDLLSLLVEFSPSGTITGLDKFAPADRPPLQATFQVYHLMVGLGIYFIALTGVGFYFAWRKGVDRMRWLLWVLVFSAPLPVLATEMGWMAAEIGRQPWVVYGQLRTAEGVSAVVPAGQVASTLGVLVLIYSLLYVGWLRIIGRLISSGPAMPATGAGDIEATRGVAS